MIPTLVPSVALTFALLLGVTNAQSKSTYTLRSTKDSTYCLTADFSLDGSQIGIAKCDPSKKFTQNWEFNDFQDSPKSLLALSPGGLCITVPRAQEGTKLELDFCEEYTIPQMWYMTSYTSETRIGWAVAGYNWCLDLPDGALNDTNKVQIWECGPNDDAQLWKFSMGF